MHRFGHPRSGIYDGKIAGLYDLEQTLGSGHFAVVKLARHVFTGEKVAVKVIDKTKLDEVSKAHLFQEVRCMKLVQHPNVVRLYEVIDTQTKLYLILELGSGDLYDYVMRHESGLSESLAREYFRQIVRAISYCHQLHVVHRDLKPENVVFFEKMGVVKLTDFGFSNKFCPGQKLETSCGSLAYSAPEILLGDSYDAPAVDVWSLGVILYMLVCGQPPFQEANDSETLTMIMDCKYTMPPHVSSGCRDLISSMLVREPEKRATLLQISNNAWLLEGAEQQQNQPEYLPLVSREQVSDDDHALIIQKMVNGNIANKEEILDALDRNEYNHISATYFLLAERKLRAHRLEQAQKKRPELTLPVTPNSRNQGNKSELIEQETQDSSLLLVPGSMARTPGNETTQKGRARKCSIVQEEDDLDEDEGDREELGSPLNRRGSRSEGRINVAVQDRLAAESDRIKKDSKPHVIDDNRQKCELIDGIAGIKIIKSDTPKEKYLGLAGSGLNKKLTMTQRNMEIRSNSVDKQIKTALDRKDVISTKVLTDSSTINIVPIPTINIVNSNQLPKFKTMPSPTRPSTVFTNPTNNCLKDIFEEQTDAGSSDTSNTTTPKPILRSSAILSSTLVAGTSASENCPPGTTTHHRRTKFKTRTTSCSSSEDEDNAENRKKRANKIIDSSKPFSHSQRRDSHDDSSDSQEQGNNKGSGNTASGGSSTTLFIRCNKTSNGSSESNSGTNQTHSSQNEKNRQKTCTKSSSGTDLGYRRNRRRPVETRLRESQSLNRITEVQECEVQSGIHIVNNRLSPLPNTDKTEDECEGEGEGEDDRREQELETAATSDESNKSDVQIVINEPKNQSPTEQNSNPPSSNHQSSNSGKTSKSFSARLFQNFKKSTSSSSSQRQKQIHIPSINVTLNGSEDGGNPPPSLLPESAVLSDLDKKSTHIRSSSNGTAKKIKILGRYFQVHKKICMPLSGLFQRGGRLYKTQSCGSIVRDKINHNTKINANTLTSSSSRNKNINLRNSGLLTATLNTRLIGGSHEELDHCQNTSYLLLTETPLKKIQKYIDDDDPDPDDNEPDLDDTNNDNISSKQQVSKYSDVSLCSKC